VSADDDNGVDRVTTMDIESSLSKLKTEHKVRVTKDPIPLTTLRVAYCVLKTKLFSLTLKNTLACYIKCQRCSCKCSGRRIGSMSQYKDF
jgi:hypothetical protein